MTSISPLDEPWPSTVAPTVQLVQLNAATIDALADEDLDLANEQAAVELSPYFVEPASANTWRRRSRQLAETPTDASWITRVIYDPTRQLAVGQSGYHGAPDADGMVEVGYAVDAAFHRQGYARAALTALLERARLEPSVAVVRASIRPDNLPSNNLIAQFGFVAVGELWDDEDGMETIFELPVG
ncbi:GNAT family protein [Cryobacterium sp. SO2]|uniref:GNAT family N-acetyltransferase n=1 Tax=Cryobacterium sp. SO2 TaxID=1897060 RepID=UPI00223E59F9|nr:GNAT family protein [Cryobacterium sp. SO2]WEO76345.1 GNAT family protein [Cryobacterium sp. SO2]